MRSVTPYPSPSPCVRARTRSGTTTRTGWEQYPNRNLLMKNWTGPAATNWSFRAPRASVFGAAGLLDMVWLPIVALRQQLSRLRHRHAPRRDVGGDVASEDVR